MRIALGADHRGGDVVERLTEGLRAAGHVVMPLGVCSAKSCDYPDMAFPVANAVSEGRADRGILVCGSGIGMSIAANKVHGVRAALIHDEIGAEASRRHNDANVLCLGADLLSQRVIENIVNRWLATEFEGGRHERRVSKIAAIERGEDPAIEVSADRQA